MTRLRLRDRLNGFRGAPLIALSGIDGSGKSTQVAALRERLTEDGYDVEVVWTRLEWTTLWESSDRLERISALIDWLPGRRGGGDKQPAPEAPASWLEQAPPTTRAGRLRRRSRFLTYAWALVVAAVHATAQRNAVMSPVREGKVVICDRYTLDAAVALRRRYSETRPLRLQVLLLSMISPRPRLAWHLDIPASIATARKRDELGVAEREREASLYLEERDRLGWRRLDAERPVEELSAQITREAEAILGSRARLRRA